MSLKEQIAELLVKNHIEQALELLQSQPNLNIHLQNDIILLQQNHQDILYREQRAVLTYEKVNVEKNKLSRTILQLTDNITAGKPPLTPSNFTEQVPSKNLLLILLVLEIAIGVFGELFPENIKTSLSNALGSAYPIVYFTVLGFTIFAFLWFSLRKEKPKTTLNSVDSFSKEEAKIRQALLERYHSRLKQKTDYRLSITLTLTYTKEGSSPDYLHFSKDMVEAQKIEGNLLEVLKKHHHLLILGDPGAGKTTQILELATAWLEKREDHRIPIVFNLAGWKNDGSRFDEWLQKALVYGYGFSKQLAKEAIFKDKILPLLDGLDEVGRDLTTEEEKNEIRSLCLRSIDQYLSLFEVKYLAICSRRTEYVAATVDAPIKAAILVNPLRPEEIKQVLVEGLKQKISTKDENAAKSLLKLLLEYLDLEIVLCNPFYYNIALEVFDERTTKYRLPTTQEDLQQFLIEAFINKKLIQTHNPKNYSEINIKNYLAWWAYTLNSESKVNFENKVNFELSDLNPASLDNKRMGGQILSWVFSFFLSLPFMIDHFMFGVIFGLFIGLIGSSSLTLSKKTVAFNSIKSPYFRFKYEFITILVAVLVILVFICVINLYLPSLNEHGLIIKLVVWIILITIIAFTSLWNHIVLRFCLYWEKKLPLRLVSFFTYATAARILEQDGGQWRFRHQILQDYFAKKWQEQQAISKSAH